MTEPLYLPEIIRTPQVAEWVQMAAAYLWANPRATNAEIGEHVGRTAQRVQQVRQTEQWDLAFRQAGAARMEQLAPAAIHALLLSWSKGNSAGAVEVLRSFGLMNAPKLDVTVDSPLAAIHRVLADASPATRAEIAERLEKLDGEIIDINATAADSGG